MVNFQQNRVKYAGNLGLTMENPVSVTSDGMQGEESLQAIARHQRSQGRGGLEVAQARGKTRIRRLFQEGSAKIRLPRDLAGPEAEAVLINTSGGLTGGDRLEWNVTAAQGAALTLTTQACEKVYRSGGGEAQVLASVRAETGARVDWLPQETIVFDGGRISRRFEANLEGDATLLVLEAVILGRRARGEEVETGSFRDSWRIRRNGLLVHAEETRFEEPFGAYRGVAAALGHNTAFATLLLVDDGAARHTNAVRGLISAAGLAGGASAWETAGSGKLLARMAARDGYMLRKALLPVVRLLKTGAANGAGLPRIWSI
jgi:urease accessory protein